MAHGEQFDRFGNPIDGTVGYARGEILKTNADEIARMMYARSVIRDRVARLGNDSLFDLTGLSRSLPLQPGDLEHLQSQASYYTHFDGTAEDQAVRFVGGDPSTHDALFVNRVTSGLLSIALALVARGQTVLSLVPMGRSHPSVQRAVELAGGRFVEVVGIERFETALAETAPRMTVATPLTAAKHHLPTEDLSHFASLSRKRGAIALVDDAHFASRAGFHGDPPPFHSGPIDLAVFSTDKHIAGPRTGVIVGRRELITAIRAKAMEFGLEAQTGQYVAALNALRHHDTDLVRRAGSLAREVLAALERKHGENRFYLAGPGVAISGEEALALTLERSGKSRPSLTPMEAASFVSNHILLEHGVMTVCSLSMPGTAPVISAMMFPDGERLGASEVLTVLESGLLRLQAVLDSPDSARQQILGPQL